MARKLQPHEVPQDLEWLLAQCLASADAGNFPLTAAHLAMAADVLAGEKEGKTRTVQDETSAPREDVSPPRKAARL